LNGKSGKSQTPFIDATVEFLKEFIEDENKDGISSRRKKDGFGFSSASRSGKGKEKEVVNHRHDLDGEGEEDEWPESFLPSYVYEAMKEKKRFESMRVCFSVSFI
jgi:ubiquitin carboxyl-terminal hydrolase 10